MGERLAGEIIDVLDQQTVTVVGTNAFIEPGTIRQILDIQSVLALHWFIHRRTVSAPGDRSTAVVDGQRVAPPEWPWPRSLPEEPRKSQK